MASVTGTSEVGRESEVAKACSSRWGLDGVDFKMGRGMRNAGTPPHFLTSALSLRMNTFAIPDSLIVLSMTALEPRY